MSPQVSTTLKLGESQLGRSSIDVAGPNLTGSSSSMPLPAVNLASARQSSHPATRESSARCNRIAAAAAELGFELPHQWVTEEMTERGKLPMERWINSKETRVDQIFLTRK